MLYPLSYRGAGRRRPVEQRSGWPVDIRHTRPGGDGFWSIRQD